MNEKAQLHQQMLAASELEERVQDGGRRWKKLEEVF